MFIKTLLLYFLRCPSNTQKIKLDIPVIGLYHLRHLLASYQPLLGLGVEAEAEQPKQDHRSKT